MLGLSALLKAENYDVRLRKETEPTKGDILIISAECSATFELVVFILSVQSI